MSEQLPTKGPGEVLDYLIDATGLLAEGEVLVEGSSSITVTGATKDSVDFTDTGVTVWLSDGTAGTLIFINASLVTDGGRTFKRLYVLPFGEPVSLEQAKAQCRVLDNTEDSLIAGYIQAAREWVEDYSGRIIVRRPLTETFAAWGDYLTIYAQPDATVDGISYQDMDLEDQDFEGFTAVEGVSPLKIYPVDTFPGLGTNGTITVSYTAGYAEGTAPYRYVQAILILIAGMFSNRGSIPDDCLNAAKALCNKAPGLA